MEQAWRDAGAALGKENREVTLGALYRQLRTATQDSLNSYPEPLDQEG